MLAVSVELLAPGMLAVALVGLLPLGIGLFAVHRSRSATRMLGLRPPPLAVSLWPAAVAALACVAGATAAAQPVLRTVEERSQRSDSEIVFVVDVSRSMLASADPEGPTRLDRAREVVRALRASVEAVPSGLTGLTDRALPYLFPTGDERAFARTLERSVSDEAPPPQQVNIVATTFEALPAVGRDGFFTPDITFRTCVLVTDGEARTGGEEGESGAGGLDSGLSSLVPDSAAETLAPSADPAVTGAALSSRTGCQLVVVRVGSASDRIYLPSGEAEAQYRPDAAAASKVERLADAAGGSAFTDDELDAAARALENAAEAGPVETVAARDTSHALAPYVAAVGAALALAVAVARTFGRVLRRRRTAG